MWISRKRWLALTASITAIQLQLAKMERNIMADLSKLKDAVAKETSVTQSAVSLIQGLAQRVRDAAAAGADQGDLNALADTISGQADALAAAVQQNTSG